MVVLLRTYVRELFCRWKSKRGAASTVAFPPRPVTVAPASVLLPEPPFSGFGVLRCDAAASLVPWLTYSTKTGVDRVRAKGELLRCCFTMRGAAPPLLLPLIGLLWQLAVRAKGIPLPLPTV